jgi:hypothetical protein
MIFWSNLISGYILLKSAKFSKNLIKLKYKNGINWSFLSFAFPVDLIHFPGFYLRSFRLQFSLFPGLFNLGFFLRPLFSLSFTKPVFSLHFLFNFCLFVCNVPSNFEHLLVWFIHFDQIIRRSFVFNIHFIEVSEYFFSILKCYFIDSYFSLNIILDVSSRKMWYRG